MRQKSGDIRPQAPDDIRVLWKKHTGIRWMLFLIAAGSLVGVAYRWQSPHAAKPDMVQTHASPVVTRKEREERPRLSNPILLELLRQDTEGKVDARRWQDIRGLSEADVEAAIMELGYPDPSRSTRDDSILRQMLFHRWGQLDPAAANALAKAMFPENFSRSREAVIAAWIINGRAVDAWEAVREEDGMWDCTRSVSGEVTEMIVSSLSGLDDAAAFAAVMRLNDENLEVADILCRARAPEALASPETRAAFLSAAAAHPEPFVLHCARKELFEEWAKFDLEAAEAGLEALSLSLDDEYQVKLLIDSVRRDKEHRASPQEGCNAKEGKPSHDQENKPSGDGPWIEVKEKVRKNWEKSPGLLVDFELRDQTAKLLEDIPVPELEIWLRELRMNRESSKDEDRDVTEQLHRMILEVLVPRGAGQFITSLAENLTGDGRWDLERAMDLWIRHDPGAAIKWLEGDVPDSMKEDLEDYLEEARHELSGD